MVKTLVEKVRYVGLIATIIGIIGLFVFPIIFGIIALIIGAIGLYMDKSKILAIIGVILGIVCIVIFVLGKSSILGFF